MSLIKIASAKWRDYARKLNKQLGDSLKIKNKKIKNKSFSDAYNKLTTLRNGRMFGAHDAPLVKMHERLADRAEQLMRKTKNERDGSTGESRKIFSDKINRLNTLKQKHNTHSMEAYEEASTKNNPSSHTRKHPLYKIERLVNS